MYLPANARAAVYIISTFINATIGVLVANDVKVPILVIAILAGFNAVVGLLAAKNVTPEA